MGQVTSKISSIRRRATVCGLSLGHVLSMAGVDRMILYRDRKVTEKTASKLALLEKHLCVVENAQRAFLEGCTR